MRVFLRQLRLYQQKLGRTHQVPLIQRVQRSLKGLRGVGRGVRATQRPVLGEGGHGQQEPGTSSTDWR